MDDSKERFLQTGKGLYRGKTKEEALRNLTANVKEKLKHKSLTTVVFEATGVLDGKDVVSQLKIPFELTADQRDEALRIIGEEITKLCDERYGGARFNESREG